MLSVKMLFFYNGEMQLYIEIVLVELFRMFSVIKCHFQKETYVTTDNQGLIARDFVCILKLSCLFYAILFIRASVHNLFQESLIADVH